MVRVTKKNRSTYNIRTKSAIAAMPIPCKGMFRGCTHKGLHDNPLNLKLIDIRKRQADVITIAAEMVLHGGKCELDRVEIRGIGREEDVSHAPVFHIIDVFM
jgi:hypothetical protein